MSKFKFGLLPKIIIAISLGILLGNHIPDYIIRVFFTFNSIFGEFLSFMIPLIIIGLVTSAIADIGKGARRLLIITTLLAYISTITAGLISYETGSITFPSLLESISNKAVDFDQNSKLTSYVTISIPPLMNVMTALILSFVLGLGITFIKGNVLKEGFIEFKIIIIKAIEGIIIPLLPIYIFGIFLNMTYNGQVYYILMAFAKIIGIIFILHILWLVFLYCVAGVVAKCNPFRALLNMMPAYFTALGTQSSAATIPVTLRQTIINGVREDIAGFVVPLCATIHMSGSMLKIVACALALMMMNGIDYSFSQFFGFICLLGISVVAGPGVPGGVIMASLGVLQSSLGFGKEEQALMIALYITMDSFGTACNVTGDGALALIINKIQKPHMNNNQ